MGIFLITVRYLQQYGHTYNYCLVFTIIRIMYNYSLVFSIIWTYLQSLSGIFNNMDIFTIIVCYFH